MIRGLAAWFAQRRAVRTVRNITCQALAGAAYEFGWGNLSLTYRSLYFDEGDGGVIHDLTMDGPVFAAGFRF